MRIEWLAVRPLGCEESSTRIFGSSFGEKPFSVLRPVILPVGIGVLIAAGVELRIPVIRPEMRSSGERMVERTKLVSSLHPTGQMHAIRMASTNQTPRSHRFRNLASLKYSSPVIRRHYRNNRQTTHETVRNRQRHLFTTYLHLLAHISRIDGLKRTDVCSNE